jgi:rubrerythrin
MANKYAGTQTEKNLLEAFAGESQARNKYTYFASKAKKDGFEQIHLYSLKQPIMKRNTQKCGSRN